MNNKIINKIKQDHIDDKDMAIKVMVSYLVSIGVIAHIRGGGLYVKNQSVYSYKRALELLGIVLEN